MSQILRLFHLSALQAVEMFSGILSEKQKMIPEALFWLSVVAVVFFIDSFHNCELVSLIKVQGERLEIKPPSITPSC